MDHFLKHAQLSIHREGLIFVGAFALATFIFFFLWAPLGWIGTLFTVWCIYFFRNPSRVTPIDPHLIIAPADGTIESITITPLPIELNEKQDETYHRISIFMNVFNVHVNRYPVSGLIKKIIYIPGKFLNASLAKSNTDNERNIILFDVHDKKVAMVQIAGLIARRIVCYAKENENTQQGKEIGLIRFGSRVDVYIPHDIEIKVLEGQLSVAGETILADMTPSIPLNINKKNN